jgi:small subunit ribosomal protein S1
MEQAVPGSISPDEDFHAAWEQWTASGEYREPRRGDLLQGWVLVKTPGEIVVDIGGKRDAIVPAYELEQLEPERLAAIHVGDKINVYVLHTDDPDHGLVVSIRRAREFEDWLRAEEMVTSGEVFQSTITGYNKGGLLCAFGRLQAFVPASQVVRMPRPRAATPGQPASEGDALAGLVGEQLSLKVIEVNRHRRRLIASERAAMRDVRALQRDQVLAELRPGQTRTGVVSSLRDFGAFVDLGGVDGLIHISELSWTRVPHPSALLTVGQQVQVQVMHVDLDAQRIGLSLKRLQPDPWTVAVAKYEPGQLVSGRVAHVAKFGAFVVLEPGVEGLVHLSELAEGEFGDPANVVSEGQEVQALVLSVEPERHRLSLSLRQVRG